MPTQPHRSRKATAAAAAATTPVSITLGTPSNPTTQPTLTARITTIANAALQIATDAGVI